MKNILVLTAVAAVVFSGSLHGNPISENPNNNHGDLFSESNQTTDSLKKAFDATVQSHFKDDEPGATILVAKSGKIVYERAIGMADIKKQTPMTLDTPLRIGSVTKQFAGVAILQLAEKGKLNVTDEIQKYIDFPVKEHPITIEHLLSHTSGIPNFTNLPVYTPEAYKSEKELSDLIAYFKDLPLEFQPGTAWNYSNSGYILLTAIIEKVSGQSWSEYTAKQILKPAGLKSSSAAIDGPMLKKEPVGYRPDQQGWSPANAISLTWPRGAGSLRSTVHDLWKWNNAVHKGKLISPASRKKAFTGYVLTDGKSSNYGYGWMFQNVQGSPTYEHGGGIDGATSNVLYLPAEDVFVAVLVNRESSDAHELAPKLAALAIGKPFGGATKPLNADQAKEYTGVFVNETGVERYIRVGENGLESQRQGSSVLKLNYLGDDTFIYDSDVIYLKFNRTEGKIAGALFQARDRVEKLTRSEKPLPSARVELPLSNAMLQPYVGQFELAPGFIFTFRAEGDRFYVAATGQPEFEVFGFGEHQFFLKVVDATFVFHPDEDGKINRLTFTQGREMPAKRVK